jgi:hypothetical protein
MTEAIATSTHPEAAEKILPSGMVLRLKPLSGDVYLKYQGKVVGLSQKGGKISAAIQWLAIQAFDVVEGNAAESAVRPLDLATVAMGLEIEDIVALNTFVNELTSPSEAEEGLLPSGYTYEKLKVKGQHFWNYQDEVTLASLGGKAGGGDAVVAANVRLACKMFSVEGETITESWLKSASFQDTAFILTELGKRIQATQAQ